MRAALAEDVGAGDLTTEARRPGRRAAAAPSSCSRSPGSSAGSASSRARLRARSTPRRAVEPLARATAPALDGARPSVARVEGPARAILTGERTALNLLGRLSGVATLTARYVERGRRHRRRRSSTRARRPRGCARSSATRSAAAAASNHRAGLYDAVLLKENHLRLAGGIAAALAALGDRDGVAGRGRGRDARARSPRRSRPGRRGSCSTT